MTTPLEKLNNRYQIARPTIQSGVSHSDAKATLHFIQLMDIYEQNYIQLKQLIHQDAIDAGKSVSCLLQGLDLHMTVIERTKFTTTIRLTYWFGQEEQVPDPDLQVRIFHDAQVAEVVSGKFSKQGKTDPDVTQYALPMKWHANRFLQKWLAYCLRQGHKLQAADYQCALTQSI